MSNEVGVNMLTVIESKIRKLQQEFFSQSSFDLSLGDSIISSNLSINWQEIDSVFLLATI